MLLKRQDILWIRLITSMKNGQNDRIRTIHWKNFLVRLKWPLLKADITGPDYPASCELSFNIQILPQETDKFGLGH